MRELGDVLRALRARSRHSEFSAGAVRLEFDQEQGDVESALGERKIGGGPEAIDIAAVKGFAALARQTYPGGAVSALNARELAMTSATVPVDDIDEGHIANVDLSSISGSKYAVKQREKLTNSHWPWWLRRQRPYAS